MGLSISGPDTALPIGGHQRLSVSRSHSTKASRPIRQAVHAVTENRPEFRVLQQLLPIRLPPTRRLFPPALFVEPRIKEVAAVFVLPELRFAPGFGGSEVVEHLVPKNADQAGPLLRVAAEGLPGLHGSQQRVLVQVFGQMHPADSRERIAIKRVGVDADPALGPGRGSLIGFSHNYIDAPNTSCASTDNHDRHVTSTHHKLFLLGHAFTRRVDAQRRA